jgi:transposase
LGIDEFALKRGQTYAALLVDLEKHQPIEVLPDRTSKTFGDWLKVHPGIEIISRDRASSFAKAARLNAPQAQQVADRFHVLVRRIDACWIPFRERSGRE